MHNSQDTVSIKDLHHEMGVLQGQMKTIVDIVEKVASINEETIRIKGSMENMNYRIETHSSEISKFQIWKDGIDKRMTKNSVFLGIIVSAVVLFLQNIVGLFFK